MFKKCKGAWAGMAQPFNASTLAVEAQLDL